MLGLGSGAGVIFGNSGGQPKTTKVINDKIRISRIEGLYDKDVELNIKCSYQNPDIIAVYDEFYKKPLYHLAHELLHTSYSSKKHMLGIEEEQQEEIYCDATV